MLNKLPAPPPDKTGWPWTEESEPLPPLQPDDNPWPHISIITPSFNQGQFIEETIRSILLQNYPNLEYIIIDGNSTDDSPEIIRKYDSWITYWVSEPDRSQSHAINKGLNRCTGDLGNWICSDDLLCKNALNQFVSNYYSGNFFCYIGKCRLIDKAGKHIRITTSQIANFEELTDIGNHWRKNDSIAQQSVLYPISIVKQIGGLVENNHYTMDYFLWGELLLNNVAIKNIPLEIGIYRWYEGQKTSFVYKVTKSLIDSALKLISRNTNYSISKKIITKSAVLKYYMFFIYHQFRSCLGVKRRISSLRKHGI
jgi:glycosyltransferase involved in cell wall biosynthesis